MADDKLVSMLYGVDWARAERQVEAQQRKLQKLQEHAFKYDSGQFVVRQDYETDTYDIEVGSGKIVRLSREQLENAGLNTLPPFKAASNITGCRPTNKENTMRIASGWTKEEVARRQALLEEIASDKAQTPTAREQALDDLASIDRLYNPKPAEVPEKQRAQLIAALKATESILDEAAINDKYVGDLSQSIFSRIVGFFGGEK